MIFDVAIIGSGPAGASAAFKLAEKGISTVIIEKETLPRYKTCGGAFGLAGRKMMPFDISEVVEKECFNIDVFFEKIDKNFSIQKDEPIITMVMRADFDNFIVKKAQELGVTLLENHKLTAITFADNIILHTSQGDVKTKFVIAADGALSKTAKLTGWEETRLLIPALEYEVVVNEEDFKRLSKSVRLDFDAIPMGYGWCFPKKNHLSIGVGAFRKINIDFKQTYRDYLEKTLKVKNIISEEMHGFQVPVSIRKDGFVKKNVFLVGDAAGFADPLSAEGITNAILSGNMAAAAIIESNLNSELAAKLYNEKLEDGFLPELRSAFKLSKLFYENETIRNFLIKKYGDRISQKMVQIMMGESKYPTDIMKTLKGKLKSSFFTKK
jgi:geranylgeranyl reductase family protein